MALKDLGYDNVQIIFSDPKNSPQLLDEKGELKSGMAFVDGKGVRTIIINAEDPMNLTRSGLIGTLSEEGSHIIGKVEGRQIATGTGYFRQEVDFLRENRKDGKLWKVVK